MSWVFRDSNSRHRAPVSERVEKMKKRQRDERAHATWCNSFKNLGRLSQRVSEGERDTSHYQVNNEKSIKINQIKLKCYCGKSIECSEMFYSHKVVILMIFCDLSDI